MIIPALDLIARPSSSLIPRGYGQVTEYKVDPAEQFNLYQLLAQVGFTLLT